MPVKRSRRIQLIVDLAYNAEQQAARNLSAAQTSLASDQQRLKEVQEYYESYSTHFSQRTRSLTATQLSHSREFLVNLDQACKAQSQQVKLSEHQVDLALTQWRQCHHKVNTLESFQERCAKAERAEQDRLEQKLLDELAANTRKQMA